MANAWPEVNEQTREGMRALTDYFWSLHPDGHHTEICGCISTAELMRLEYIHATGAPPGGPSYSGKA